MAEYTFYTNPRSRGQIARWALHEVDAAYDQVIIEMSSPRSPEFLAINPMGKVPVLVHHSDDGDHTITEAAAICAYLADLHPEAGLFPDDDEKADYYRWLFFAAGPVEQAITSRALGVNPTPMQEAMAGFGSFDRMLSTLESHLETHDWVCGERFTMADVYVGSQVDWGLTFGTIPPREAFVAYAERLQARPAYKAAKAIDNKLIKESGS